MCLLFLLSNINLIIQILSHGGYEQVKKRNRCSPGNIRKSIRREGYIDLFFDLPDQLAAAYYQQAGASVDRQITWAAFFRRVSRAASFIYRFIVISLRFIHQNAQKLFDYISKKCHVISPFLPLAAGLLKVVVQVLLGLAGLYYMQRLLRTVLQAEAASRT